MKLLSHLHALSSGKPVYSEMVSCSHFKSQYHPLSILMKTIFNPHWIFIFLPDTFLKNKVHLLKLLRITNNLPWQLEGSISLTMKYNLSSVKTYVRTVISMFQLERTNNSSKSPLIQGKSESVSWRIWVKRDILLHLQTASMSILGIPLLQKGAGWTRPQARFRGSTNIPGLFPCCSF